MDHITLKYEDKEYYLLQATDISTGEILGLYLAPLGLSVDDFVKEFQENEQDFFDENNTLGVIRIFAYDTLLDFYC